MGALTADRSVPDIKHLLGGVPAGGGLIIDYTVAASTTIYKGAFVRIDAGGDIEPVSGSSVEPCLGFAMAQANNSGGADGDITCPVMVGAIIEHDVASTTLSNIGDPAYCADDQTLNLTVTTNELAGWIVNFITGDLCLVKMAWPGQVDV